MAHAVTLVMIDIVKSRTIHDLLKADVGDLVDRRYTEQVYNPCHARVMKLLTTHEGRLHDAPGDQFTAYFDNTQPAIKFALDLQRLMSADPIAVPDGCDCPHLQLHVAVGRGSMESVAYQSPGAARVGAFNELARVLAVTAHDQILVTDEVKKSAGRVAGVTWHPWEIVLPKEEDRLTVLELLWDGREPPPQGHGRRHAEAVRLAEENNALARRTQDLEGENRDLKATLTAALERVQARGHRRPPSPRAIDAARRNGDLTQLDTALDAEWSRREAQIKEQARDWLDLCRESAAVAFLRGDIDKAQSRLEMVFRFHPDDLDATNQLGHIHDLRGRLDEAETCYRRVLELARDDEGWQAKAYGNLGIVLKTRGDLDGAEAMYRKSLDINEKLGRLEGTAIAYGNLGIVLKTRGDLDGAEAMYRKSLAIDEKLGRLEGMANQYGNLGNVLKGRGDLDGAEAMHRKSLAIDEKLGRLEGMASDYGNLGIVLRTRGDLDGAEAMYRKSLAIDEKLGRLEGMASDYGNLGIVLRTRGDLDGAEAMYRKSLAIEEKLGRLEGMASDYGNLGIVLETRGDLDGAEAMYRKSLAIEEKLGRLEGMASDYGNLGNVLKTRGDLDGAEAMYRKSLAIEEKLGRLEGMASDYGNLGLVLKTRGDLDEAEAMYRRALAINEKLGRLEGMANQYGNLGIVLKTRGDLDGHASYGENHATCSPSWGRGIWSIAFRG